METINERITALRKEKGLSKNQLAKLLGVSKTIVTQWENGNRSPKRSNAARLCDLFGVTEAYLFGDKETTTSISIPLYTSGNIANLPEEHIVFPPEVLPNDTCFALKIEDDSARGFGLRKGDIGIFRRIEGVNLPDDSDVVCSEFGGKLTVSMIRKGNPAILVSGDPRKPERVVGADTKIVGKLALSITRP